MKLWNHPRGVFFVLQNQVNVLRIFDVFLYDVQHHCPFIFHVSVLHQCQANDSKKNKKKTVIKIEPKYEHASKYKSKPKK